MSSLFTLLVYYRKKKEIKHTHIKKLPLKSEYCSMVSIKDGSAPKKEEHS